MPIPWSKRKDRVKLYDQKIREEGTLAYWNKRARWLNSRAIKEYGILTGVTGQELMDKYKNSRKKCRYCKQEVMPGDAHFDHIKPLKNDGQHTISNIGISCPTCNLSKGSISEKKFKEKKQRELAKAMV